MSVTGVAWEEEGKRKLYCLECFPYKGAEGDDCVSGKLYCAETLMCIICEADLQATGHGDRFWTLYNVSDRICAHCKTSVDQCPPRDVVPT